MISRARSSGHGWKANWYFSVSVQGPGVAGSPARSPSVFLRPPHSVSPPLALKRSANLKVARFPRPARGRGGDAACLRCLPTTVQTSARFSFGGEDFKLSWLYCRSALSFAIMSRLIAFFSSPFFSLIATFNLILFLFSPCPCLKLIVPNCLS